MFDAKMTRYLDISHDLDKLSQSWRQVSYEGITAALSLHPKQGQPKARVKLVLGKLQLLKVFLKKQQQQKKQELMVI